MNKSLLLAACLTMLVCTAQAGWVTDTIRVGAHPQGLAVNPATGEIYVACMYDSAVHVIDAYGHTTRLSLAGMPGFPVDNPLTNRVYVSMIRDLAVIDGATGNVAYIAVAPPSRGAVNSITNRIYFCNYRDSSITVINPSANQSGSHRIGRRSGGEPSLRL
jgi:DNA-binding beta-propeller fold protein YncE